MSEIRIGISGWRYELWRGEFYPKGLAQRRELEYASRKMNSIEINGTFYSLQTPKSYLEWHAETPDDFVFAIKGSKYISHKKRLTDIRIPLANFFASGVLHLGKKIGPILWQFPPWERCDLDRLEAFLELLPRTAAEAAELASENTIKDPTKAFIGPAVDLKLRYAFEFRHQKCISPEMINLLRKHNASLVFADTAGKWPFAEDVTADFVYIRLHGSKEIYVSGYTESELQRWAKRIRLWAKGAQPDDAVKITDLKPKKRKARDIYAYFDNDVKVRAPFDAMRLAEILAEKK